MKTLQISTQKARELYKKASNDLKVLLEENFTKEELQGDITERVKRWRDIVNICGGYFQLPYPNPVNKRQISLNACAKLQVITEVLNEEWVPDFKNKNQQKWYPYFIMTNTGWVFNLADCNYNYGLLGSDFYFKSEELAKYAGTVFIDIYKEYLPL